MQFRLIVMRHAKSDWSTTAASDHARPLNRRGQKDAPRVARELDARGWMPQAVFSSDALRTKETWELMRAEFHQTPDQVEFCDTLYHAGIREIRSLIAMLTEEVQTAMVLGHNPGWQAAVATLTGEFTSLTTANAALLEIEDSSWAAAIEQDHAWHLRSVIRPKELD